VTARYNPEEITVTETTKRGVAVSSPTLSAVST
jgi:hypothetical protein